MTKSIAAGQSRAWVEVDLDALARNARRFQARMDRPIMPMVKADAYGLGLEAVTRALEPLEPWGYGVATVEEGAALRQAGIDRPILVFTPLYPRIMAGCLASGLRPSIGSIEMLERWLAAGGGAFHLAVDTGMARSGVPWHEHALWARLADLLAGRPEFEGMYTHLHSAGEDPGATQAQFARFEEVVRRLRQRPLLLHAANSASEPGYALDLVRPGIFLYGGRTPALEPEPVARFQARVVAVRRVRAGDTVSYGATWRAGRDTTVATLAVGYADGLHRTLSNRGRVELGGVCCPIVGRVTMDLTMIAVDGADVAVEDIATIFGGLVTLDAQADLAGTIAYELLTALGPRVPRLYRSAP